MSLCVPCAHMSECIPYRDTMRNSVKMSKKRSAKQKVSNGSARARTRSRSARATRSSCSPNRAPKEPQRTSTPANGAGVEPSAATADACTGRPPPTGRQSTGERPRSSASNLKL